MNMDYIFAAKVIADFLQADDSAYENQPDIALEQAKKILQALSVGTFRVVHFSPNQVPPQTEG